MREALTLATLSPLLLAQALWVRARAARLQEARGPRAGHAGQGPALRLLILGDSSAAGVGVAHQNDALVGHLVAGLGDSYAVDWQLIAHCGAITLDACDWLRDLPDQRFDAAVIALGVNDVKNGVRQSRWQAATGEMLDLLTDRFGTRAIVHSGLPPLGRFPLLPRPLRDVLGMRAARFDRALHEIVGARPAAHHLGFHLPLDPAMMAQDRFHPGPEIYRLWGQAAAQRLSELLSSPEL